MPVNLYLTRTAYEQPQHGAGEGIRTPDPLITNQMLYRLSYASGHKLIILLARPLNCKARKNIFSALKRPPGPALNLTV